MPLKWLSLNVKGLNHPAKRFSFWEEASKAKADIVCVQETHFHQAATPKCTHKDYQHTFFANATEKKRGVLIAVGKSMSFQLKSSHLDPNGRFIILTGDLNSKPYTLVTIYAPNSHQIRFLRRVFKAITSRRYRQLLMGGDFNLTADPHRLQFSEERAIPITEEPFSCRRGL